MVRAFTDLSRTPRTRGPHARQKLLPRSRFGWVRVMGWLEQEPDPANRVTLSRERDALGQPRAHLTLGFSRRKA